MTEESVMHGFHLLADIRGFDQNVLSKRGLIQKLREWKDNAGTLRLSHWDEGSLIKRIIEG